MFEALGREVPGYRVDLREEFGAQHAEHRVAIRRSVAHALDVPTRSFENLDRRPEPENWSVSVSHAPTLGGWLAVPSPARVGFDVETRARVREEIIRRVCAPEEFALTDNHAGLWSAKEALFKVAARGQAATLTQLRIYDWRDEGCLAYFTGAGGAHGYVQTGETLAAAWCLLPPEDLKP